MPFTDQEELADRKSAAIAAINSLSAGGGGDTPETGFDGLRLALNGALGQWRPAGGTLKVVLFTNSSIKDYELANEISELAHNIGATSIDAIPGSYVNTYNLGFNPYNPFYGDPGVWNEEPYNPCQHEYIHQCTLTGESTNIPFVPSNEPIEIVPMTAQVQIFTIFTGSAGSNTKALEAIANANGGTFQTASTNDDLLKKLVAIVSAPSIEPTLPTVAVIATDSEAAETKPGEIAAPGQFVLTRTGDLSRSLTVNYTLSGTATQGSDYQNQTDTITFAVGQDSANVDLNILDDNISEGIETISLTIAQSSNYSIDSSKSDAIAIFDNDFPPTQLIQPTANILSIAGGEGRSVLKFTKLAASNRNEIAAFVVDDAEGRIDGILPGDRKYLAAAIARSRVIFSALGNSDLDRQFDSNSERYLNFNAGDRLQFLLIPDDTLDSVRTNLSAGNPTPNVIFSLPAANLNNFEPAQFTALANNGGYQIAWSDRLDNGETSIDKFADLIVRVETADREPLTAGNNLQGSPLGEVIDLRNFSERSLKLDLNTVSDAQYNNYIGFYAVEDELGTLANGLKPGDADYVESAVRSAILQSFKSESKSDVSIAGGKILAPVVIANGNFEDFLKLTPQNREERNIHAYFNYLGANSDKVDHFRLLGDNKFGVEDFYGGGDRDYNDLIVTLAFKN